MKGNERANLVRLRELLTAHLSVDDLRTLCFDLGIEYENLPATVGGLAREVLRLCERQDCIPELVEACKRLRPGAAWNGEPEPAGGFPAKLVQIMISVPEGGAVEICVVGGPC